MIPGKVVALGAAILVGREAHQLAVGDIKEPTTAAIVAEAVYIEEKIAEKKARSMGEKRRQREDD